MELRREWQETVIVKNKMEKLSPAKHQHFRDLLQEDIDNATQEPQQIITPLNNHIVMYRDDVKK